MLDLRLLPVTVMDLLRSAATSPGLACEVVGTAVNTTPNIPASNICMVHSCGVWHEVGQVIRVYTDEIS